MGTHRSHRRRHRRRGRQTLLLTHSLQISFREVKEIVLLILTHSLASHTTDLPQRSRAWPSHGHYCVPSPPPAASVYSGPSPPTRVWWPPSPSQVRPATTSHHYPSMVK